MDVFQEDVKKDAAGVRAFCDALKNGDAKKAEAQFQAYLRKTISIRDTFVRKQLKENFYHGILLGLLACQNNWGISSNRESGDGYSDILIEIEEEETGIIIEVKYAQDGDLEEGCQKALAQIEANHYKDQLREDGICHILKYGIACFKKCCRIIVAGCSCLQSSQ